MRIPILADPNFTILGSVEHDHIGAYVEKSKTMAESFKSNHWLFKDIDCLEKGQFCKIIEFSHLTFELNENFTKAGSKVVFVVQKNVRFDFSDGEMCILPPLEYLFVFINFFCGHCNDLDGIHLNLRVSILKWSG